jgi:hypothetical protein
MSPLQELLADASRHGIDRLDIARMGQCATGALGTHQRRCDSCDHTIVVPNACRSRACPFCRQRERGEWVRAIERDLPPVSYFHVVITVPEQLRPFAATEPALFSTILMTSCKKALLDICGDPKHLGVTPVAFAVLHTWNQRLHLHPHVHMVVSAGGMTPEGTWKHAGDTRKKAFLVPQRVLMARFKTLMINGLLQAHHQGKWKRLDKKWDQYHAFRHFLLELGHRSWNVHLDRPLAGPDALVRYLARYVNRVAIAPERVITYDGSTVSFSWTDRRDHQKKKIETIPAAEFLKRFCRHIPPKGFVRIRFWGLLSNRKKGILSEVRAAILCAPAPINLPQRTEPIHDQNMTPKIDPTLCPICGIGHFQYDGHRLIPPRLAKISPPNHTEILHSPSLIEAKINS